MGGAGGRGGGGSGGPGEGGRAAAVRGCSSGTGPHRPARLCPAQPSPRRPADGHGEGSGSAMASGGPEEGEAAAGEEQALRKLVVRLQNVQERKRLETLVQTLSDLLELAARQSGERPA